MTTFRARMAAEAQWGANHEPLIHYIQSRPIPYRRFARHELPLGIDCSAFVTCCAFAAGVPDPNGRAYDGSGFTGTLSAHLEHIKPTELEVADFVGFGDMGSTDSHVVIVVSVGPQPVEVISHGGESGPRRLRLVDEISLRRAAGNPVEPITYLRSVPADFPASPPKRWTVFRDGEVAGHTNHPHVWDARHPRRYRHTDHDYRYHRHKGV